MAWYPASTYSVVPDTFAASSERRYAAAAPQSSDLDLAMERRALLEHRLHRREARDRACRERAHGARRDRVHADVLEPEIPGEVADARVEGRLRDAHDVVVRDGALAPEIGHRHDRAAAARLHQRLGRREHATNEYALMSTAIQKRSRGVSTKRPSRSSAAANATEWTRTSSPPPNASDDLGEDAGEVVVGADVALGDERAVDARGEIAHVLLDALALVREGDARALVGEPLRDRPGDRALVRDAEDERLLAFEPAGHRGDPNRLASRGDGGNTCRGRHRSLDRDRRGDRARARPQGMALRPPRASRRPARARCGGDRRRMGDLRRLRSRAGGRGRRTRPRTPPVDRPAREQRRRPGAGKLPRRRPRGRRAGDPHQLSRRRLVPAGLRARRSMPGRTW